MKKSQSNAFVRFVEGKGFYVILAVCIAAIGISGYLIFNSGLDSSQDLKDLNLDYYNNYLEELPEQGDVDTEPVASPEKIEEPDDATPTGTSAAEDKQSEEAVYTLPCSGRVIIPYSGEQLTYSKTLDDWRVHQGVDYAGKIGDKVCAIAGGTVKSVYEDELMGVTVIVQHSDGLISVYSNLSANPPVKDGDKVAMAQVIGGIGQSSSSEMREAPHLHFEILKNGIPQDPDLYFKK